MNKVTETFQSRKFWITMGMFAMAASLFVTGYIDVDRMTGIVEIAAGVYVGGLSIIDAAKKLIPILETMLGE
jgi:hypothetical protein